MRSRTAITLHAFTSVPRLAEVLAPVKLVNALPQWWSQLEAYARNSQPKPNSPAPSRVMTIKHCYAVQEVFKYGIGLPLWSDMNIVIAPDGTVSALGPNRQIGRAGMTHPEHQYTGAFDERARHFKFHSPWAFVCAEPVHFIWTQPFYHQPSPFRFHTMPGVVEYCNQHSTNVNVMFQHAAGERREMTFAAGEMLVYLLPATERKVNIEVSEVSPSQMERINFARQITRRPLLFNRRFGVRPLLSFRR